MSSRIFESNAERQRAYRERRATRGEAAEAAPPTPCPEPRRRRLSRPARLQAAMAAIEELREEYEDWLEHLPVNLAQSEPALHLQEVIGQLQEAAAILDSIEPPRVGR